jgi:hypothetical protein
MGSLADEGGESLDEGDAEEKPGSPDGIGVPHFLWALIMTLLLSSRNMRETGSR